MNQPEFAFDQPAPATGYDRWQQERQEALRELARQLGLPLGHEVEVWLTGGVRLRGKLRLREDGLFVPNLGEDRLEFAIGNNPFTAGEIESCIRTD